VELIASGAQADVYRHNTTAIKLFKKNVNKQDIEQEIKLQKMAAELGLPVPKVYDTIELDGKCGIVMEYIDGISVGKIILNNTNEMQKYVVKSIEIQIDLHKIVTNNFPSMKKLLQRNINHTVLLNSIEKQNILEKIDTINFDTCLCHGDFHLMNLIKTSHTIIIIDWINSSSGNSNADVYRTYMLYNIYYEKLGELYIENYCKIAKVSKENILAWAPIIAGARLAEGVEDVREIAILKEIVKNGI
jgi:uncharacterized protein (TIGR02172 family)